MPLNFCDLRWKSSLLLDVSKSPLEKKKEKKGKEKNVRANFCRPFFFFPNFFSPFLRGATTKGKKMKVEVERKDEFYQKI
jgi:hypothetical protein